MSMELRLAPSPTRGLRTRLGGRDSVNGWSILQRNTGKLKVTSARVNRGKGFMHIVTFVFECVHNNALDLFSEDFVKSTQLFTLLLFRSTRRKLPR